MELETIREEKSTEMIKQSYIVQYGNVPPDSTENMDNITEEFLITPRTINLKWEDKVFCDYVCECYREYICTLLF